MKYRNPPIIEALCQFDFIPGQPWDNTIPGILYKKIEDKFPLKQQKKGYDIQLQSRDKEILHEVKVSDRLQFLSTDRHSLVQVGPNLVTANCLEPYPSWEIFKPMILETLAAYIEVGKPKGIKRIGLRYINVIDFRENQKIEIESYFNFYPHIPESIPQLMKSFNLGIDIPTRDESDNIRIIFSDKVPVKKDTTSFLLDIDYSLIKPDSVSFDNAFEWIEDAHLLIEKIFEASITDICRELFK